MVLPELNTRWKDTEFGTDWTSHQFESGRAVVKTTMGISTVENCQIFDITLLRRSIQSGEYIGQQKGLTAVQHNFNDRMTCDTHKYDTQVYTNVQ